MNNNYALSVIVVVSPKATAKKLEETLCSIQGQVTNDSVQVIVVMDGDKKEELVDVLASHKGNVEVVSEASLCPIKGTYLNVLEAGECWEENFLSAIKEPLDTQKIEIIQSVLKKNSENGMHYIQSEATEFMMDLAPVVFHNKYQEQVLSIIQAEALERLLGITSIYLQAGKYLSVARMHVKYKETVLNPELDWYTYRVQQAADKMTNKAKELYGEEPYYVQNIVMNLISACLKSKRHKELSEEEKEAFKNYFTECIMNMDDMIISKGGLNAALRMYVFELKYGKGIWQELKYRKGKIKFRNLIVFNLNNAFIIKKIQKTENGDQTEIRLTINNPLDQKFSYAITDDLGGSYPLEKDTEVMEKTKSECFGKVLTKEVVYKALVPTSILDTMQYEYRCLNFYTGSMQMKEKV